MHQGYFLNHQGPQMHHTLQDLSQAAFHFHQDHLQQQDDQQNKKTSQTRR